MTQGSEGRNRNSKSAPFFRANQTDGWLARLLLHPIDQTGQRIRAAVAKVCVCVCWVRGHLVFASSPHAIGRVGCEWQLRRPQYSKLFTCRSLGVFLCIQCACNCSLPWVFQVCHVSMCVRGGGWGG